MHEIVGVTLSHADNGKLIVVRELVIIQTIPYFYC
jgi:hypothetical protein